MKFETLAIHAGQEPDPNNGAVMTPVYLTSTYMQDGIGRPRQGYEYSRTLNPTRKALQDCLAELESGTFGLAFASGMALPIKVMRQPAGFLKLESQRPGAFTADDLGDYRPGRIAAAELAVRIDHRRGI